MKYCGFVFLSFFFLFCFSQEDKRYSFTFSNSPLIYVIEEVELKTDQQFFFAEEWIEGILITKNFENKTLTEILDQLLEQTTINYFKTDDNRIIFTQNTIIYSSLSETFRKAITKEENIDDNLQKEQNQPILTTRKIPKNNVQTKVVRIGKAILGREQKEYTLKGTIRNSENGQPLANVNVLEKSKNLGTVTNPDGTYEIILPAGANLIETQALGIETIRYEAFLYNDGTLDFSLNEVSESLDEVIVSVSALKNINNATAGTNYLDAEETKNIPLVMGERDVLKVATTLPGVSSAGEGAAGFNVRGGKSDQNLILLDGAVLYNPSHFFGIFPALNPFSIQDISIYKGAIPAQYGGRLSSVFDIKSKNPSKDKFKGEFSLGPVTTNAIVEVPIKKNKSSLMVGGRGTYSDWVLKLLEDEKLKNSKANFYDAIAKYHHVFSPQDKVSALAYFSNDTFSITSDSLYGYKNRVLNLKWEHQFNEKNSVNIKLSNSNYQFNIDYDGSVSRNFTQKYSIDEKHFKFIVTSILNEKHTIGYGVSSKYYAIAPGEKNPLSNQDIILPVRIAEEYALENGVFISDNFKVNNRLLLDLGLRYPFYFALGPSTQSVYFENRPKSSLSVENTFTYKNNEIFQTYGGLEARFSGRYLFSDSFSLKMGYHNIYQFIHTLTNATTASPIDTWKLSDKNIKPQQSQQISLGLYKNLKENTYEISLEGFYKKQKELLDFKTGASLLLNERIETEVLQGSGVSHGVEFLIRKNSGTLTGWIGYTYSRSLQKLDSPFREERVNSGNYFPSNFDKPHDLSVVLNYKFTRRVSLSSNIIYQSGRPVTFPVGSYSFNQSEFVLYSNRNQFRIPDYFRIDFGLNIEGNHKIKKFAHSFWSISVYNILGRKNPYSIFFISQDGEVQGLQSTIFGIPVPSISYNFKF